MFSLTSHIFDTFSPLLNLWRYTMQTVTDERYLVVEEAITQAFFQLSHEKDAWHITVADITRRAGIVRSTFYNHYEDMPSFINAIEDKTIDEIFRIMKSFHPEGSSQICYSFFLSLCNYTKNNKFLADIFKRPEASDFLEKSLTMFHKYAREVSPTSKDMHQDKELTSYAIAYSIGGVVGILHKWSMDDFVADEKNVAQYLSYIFLNGYRPLFPE